MTKKVAKCTRYRVKVIEIIRRCKMKIRLLDLCAVSLVAFLAWFATFAIECYYHGVDSERRQRYGHVRDHQPPFPGDKDQNIFWFLQVSDIHLSYVDKMAVATDLERFCTETVSVISPSLVLVTGDITHAKFSDNIFSRQFEVEWHSYQEVLKKCRVRQKLPWLDLRGNHDSFDVSSHSDSSNHFREYSLSWEHHGSLSYCYIHNTSFGSYNFMAVDACPNPGPKRPLNFFGILHNEDLEYLKQLSQATSSRVGPNQTIWLTHYPSLTITTDHRHLREAMSSAVAHVCGHLHTLGNTVLQMYGRHPSGHLELELGDFVGNRRYRLLAIDHDLLSFIDTRLNQWPLVLITNPKDAHFIVPSREPTKRMTHSTHIRLLAFSPDTITTVTVWVDGEKLMTPAHSMDGALYAFPWQPAKYAAGLHTIRVYVKDKLGRETEVQQLFSLDGTIPPLQTLPQLLLLTDVGSLARVGFFFLWFTLLSLLLLAWVNHAPSSYFYPLVQSRHIYFPLLITFCYSGLGPWYFGEIITGVYGSVSVHGVRVGGHFVPGSMTYVLGILQILLFYFPLTYYLNHVMSHDSLSGRGFSSHCCSCCFHVMMVLLLLFQCLQYRNMVVPYGVLAVLISPGMTWVFLLAIVLIGMAFWTQSTHGRRTRTL